MEILIGIIYGLLLRLALVLTGLHDLIKYITFSELVISSQYSVNNLRECRLLMEKMLPMKEACQENALPMLTLYYALTFIGSFERNIEAVMLIFMSTAFQIVTALCLYRLGTERSEWAGFHSWIFYFLNPVVIVGTYLSPVPYFRHALLSLAFVSANEKCHGCHFFCLALLIAWNPQFIVLVPVLGTISGLFRRNGGANLSSQLSTLFFEVTFAFLGIACLLLIIVGLSNRTLKNPIVWTAITRYQFPLLVMRLFFDPPTDEFSSLIYSPAAGITWYLDAQIFAKYSPYFSTLINVQSYMLAIPIYLRFGSRNPMAAVHLLTAIVIYFDRNASFVDLLFVVSLLSSHPTVIARMKYKAFISIGILIPLVVSPVMFHQWAYLGTGNANFLFFQGLVMWIFCALGLIEYAAALAFESNTS